MVWSKNRVRFRDCFNELHPSIWFYTDRTSCCHRHHRTLDGIAASINPTLYGTAASNRSAMFRNSQVKLPHIYDGTHTTIIIVETAGRPLTYRGRTARPDLSNDQGICWADSEGGYSLDGSSDDGSLQGQGPILTPRTINATNFNEPYAFHPNGANCLFADGHVQFVNERVKLEVFAAACTRNAGELLVIDELQ